MRRLTLSACPPLLLLTVASTSLWGQDYRATITGIVTDSEKAVIPAATVTILDLDVNQTRVVKTTGDGSYAAPFLKPGEHYQVSVEAPGFRHMVLKPLVLSVGQVATANVQMQPGAASEQVTVTDSSGPMLDMQKADIGSLIDNKTISEMPLNGRNLFSLATLSAGVTNQYGEGSAFGSDDLRASTYFSVNGGAAGNTNVTIDGMQSNSFAWYGNGVSSIPSVDSVQEFKMVTSPYDASYGHTAGGVLDLSLKAGTNKIHGAVWEYLRRTWLDANDWYSNANDTPRQAHKEDQYGFEVDGPVVLPKIYDGRDKTFFMVTSEFYRHANPAFRYFDVPDPQWFQGDFSNLYDQAGNQIPIYDPNSANAANGYERTQFTNNQIPAGQLDPVALKIMSYYPKPNYKPPYADPWEMAWANERPDTDSFNNYIVRIDQNVGTADHVFVDVQKNTETEYSWWGPDAVGSNGDLPFSQHGLTVGLDWVHSFGHNLTGNLHANYARYDRTTQVAINNGFDMTDLGLPQNLASQVTSRTALTMFPQINTDGFMTMGRDFYYMPADTYSYGPNGTWIHGRHTTRFGADVNVSHYTDDTNWTGGLELNFDETPTREFWNQSGSDTASNQSGNSIASMLLGDLGGSAAQVEAKLAPIYSWHYYAPWVQDDWKLTQRFTLNLGLRWDFIGPPSERHNHMNYGFDANATSPLNAQINAAAVPGLAPLTGGLTFAGVHGNGNTAYNLDWRDWQPRIGFAYAFRPTTVLRGGYGTFYISPTTLPKNTGYDYYNTSVNSLDGGRTILPRVLDNPFPRGVAAAPGNSAGLATNAGLALSYYDRDSLTPYTREFTLGIEQQAGAHSSFSLNYVTTRGEHQNTSISTIDSNASLYASCDYTAGGDRTRCEGRVANPFYGLASVAPTMSDSTTISKYQIARPHPQFSGITENLRNDGHSWYNSLQATYREHLRSLDLNASYTWSKLMQSGGYIDDVYAIPLRDISSMDQAQRLTLSMVAQLPFGRGREFFNGVNRLADLAIGGWELSTILTVDSGQPWQMPTNANVVGKLTNGAIKPLSGVGLMASSVNPCVAQWQGNSSDSTGNSGQWAVTPYSQQLGCTLQDVAFHVRTGYMPKTTQAYSDQIRNPGYYGLDTNLSKDFAITEAIKLQLRLECFNVLNHPTFNSTVGYGGYDDGTGNTYFGDVNKIGSGQTNSPRSVQLAAKLHW